jgi:hypothetical protein
MDNSLKTRKEVAAMLGINRKTLYSKEKKKNLPSKQGRLNPFEVQQRIDLFNLSDKEFDQKYGLPQNTPT